MSFRKKGQLTIFVIIALVIVAIVILFFYLNGGFGEATYGPEVEVLRQNTIECYTASLRSSLAIAGLQGGYVIDVPEPYIDNPVYYVSFRVPYYYYEGEVKYPSIESVENNIGDFLLADVEGCLEQLKVDETYDSVEYDKGRTTITIDDDEVIMTIGLVMTVSYENQTSIVDFAKKEERVDSKIKGMHEIAVFIADYYERENEWTPYSDVVSLAREKGLYVSIVDSDDGMENGVAIRAVGEGYIPEIYTIKNRFAHDDLSEVEVLLA